MTPRLPALSAPARSHPRAAHDLGGPVGTRRPFAFATVVALIAAALLAVTWGASDAALEGVASGAAWLQARNDVAARAALSVVLVAAFVLLTSWPKPVGILLGVLLGVGLPFFYGRTIYFGYTGTNSPYVAF